ncbi:MAG: S10 family peptidase [Verrucomicrobiales bacterium]
MRTFLLAALLSLSLLPAAEKNPPAKDPQNPPPLPAKVSKEASVTIDGQKISYEVTAATLILKKDDGSPRASIFHTSYIRKDLPDGQKSHERPVIFAFNGGPGSSSVWLHLGALGPRIVPTSADGTQPLAPPHQVVENPQSILDLADLVFIDPVSTGYSRPEKDGKKSDFHGVREDISSIADFIRRWTSENERWASPKFLLGESYGGIRAAGLASHLQERYGMNLNGVVLLSSLLDFRTLRAGSGDDLPHSVFLPVFTATAHHHGKIKGDRDQLYREAEAYAFGPYASLLLKGSRLSAEERQQAASKLAALTGLPAQLWADNKLRLSPSRFRTELLRAEKKVLGRFDARAAWPNHSPRSDYPDHDPSYAVVHGAFSTAMLDYLTRELGWQDHKTYEILTGEVHPWNWGRGNEITNLSDELAEALRDNPRLRILVMGGYTDLATPPSGIHHSLDHLLDLPPAARRQITSTWYEAGHMFYLNEPDLKKMRQDLKSFLQAE